MRDSETLRRASLDALSAFRISVRSDHGSAVHRNGTSLGGHAAVGRKLVERVLAVPAYGAIAK